MTLNEFHFALSENITHDSYMFYLLGPHDFNIVLFSLTLILVLCVGFSLAWLVIQTSRKIADVKDPHKRGTYCVLSLLVLEALRVYLLLNLALTLFRAMFLTLGNVYYHVVQASKVVRLVYSLLTSLAQLSFQAVLILHLFEWWALVYIIST